MKPILVIDLEGPSGNIFAVVAEASTLLERYHREEEAKTIQQRVLKTHSYEEALLVIQEYVELMSPFVASMLDDDDDDEEWGEEGV